MSSHINDKSDTITITDVFPEANSYTNRQDHVDLAIQDRTFSSNFALSICRSKEKSTLFLCDQAGEPRQRKSGDTTGSEYPCTTVFALCLTSSKNVDDSFKL
ncbi:hypothetical protein GEMRC1_012163 [Eukaryota sp. GEM-RC1]